MDSRQIEQAKQFIKTRYKAYLKSVTNGDFSDEKVQAFLFDIFIEGRKQALEEIEAIAKKRWEGRYNRYAETMSLVTEEELSKELEEDADTMTIREVIDRNHSAWQDLDNVLGVLLRKIAVQAEERKRSTK